MNKLEDIFIVFNTVNHRSRLEMTHITELLKLP